MATTLKLVSIFFVIIFAAKRGLGQCTLGSISVSQSATGGAIHGQPERRVVVSNGCVCDQSDLLLSCPSFNSTLSVDPAVLRVVDGERCLVNDGMPVFQGNDIVFDYASSTEYSFAPLSSQINCS